MGNTNEELKSELSEFLLRLEEKALIVYGNLWSYKTLVECTYDERLEILRMFEGFFLLTKDALMTNIIVRIFNLYDKGPDAKRAIHNYLKRARDAAHAIAPSHDQIYNKENLVKTIDYQLTQIENARPTLDKIDGHRTKYRAHSDKHFFDDPERILRRYPLSIEELVEIDELTRSILKSHHLWMTGNDWEPILPEAMDLERLVKFIEQGRDALILQSADSLKRTFSTDKS